MIQKRMLGLSVYKILLDFKGLLRESIILFIAPLHLQSILFCSTIARPLLNIRPPTDSPFPCHTSYNIDDGNIV